MKTPSRTKQEMKNRLLRRNVLMSLVLVSVFLLAVAADGSHDDRSAVRPAPYAFLHPLMAKERAWPGII